MALERRAGRKRIKGDNMGSPSTLQPQRKVMDNPPQKICAFDAPAPEVVSRLRAAIGQIRRIRKQQVARPINGIEKIAQHKLDIAFPIQCCIEPRELERPRIDIDADGTLAMVAR